MIDGNTYALNVQERKEDRADFYSSAYDVEVMPLTDKIRELAEEIKNIAMRYEDDFNLDMDYYQTLLDAIEGV